MPSLTDVELRKRLDLGRKSVLIIEESSFGLKIVADMCRDFGLNAIFAAKSLDAGFGQLNTAPFALVICDWGRPPLDGPAFARRVRSSNNEHTKRLPIILMKAQPTPADVLAAREAGANEFLARPFSAQALLDRIAVIFSKPREFVAAQTFNGPDRRRRAPAEHAASRRKADAAPG